MPSPILKLKSDTRDRYGTNSMPEHYFERYSSQETPVFEGIEFIELATANPEALDRFLVSLGFSAQARHRSKAVTLYRQGSINLVVNATLGSFAADFAARHGTAICALALRTPDATSAYQNLLGRGAWETVTTAGAMELNIPAIESIGGSQIYLIDRYTGEISIYDIDFKPIPGAPDDLALLQSLQGLEFSMSTDRQAPWRDLFHHLFGFQPEDESRVRIDAHTHLLLNTGGAPDPSDERITAILFNATDPGKLKGHLEQQQLETRVLDAGEIFEVLPPFDDLSVRFLISC